MEASSGIFNLYRERLDAAEKLREQESEWTREGMCLVSATEKEIQSGDL